MNWLKYLAVAVLLAGCAKQGVGQGHIDTANEVCGNNGGIRVIANATYEAELVSCGYKRGYKRGCTTGKVIYRMDVVCQNEATFKKEWTK